MDAMPLPTLVTPPAPPANAAKAGTAAAPTDDANGHAAGTAQQPPRFRALLAAQLLAGDGGDATPVTDPALATAEAASKTAADGSELAAVPVQTPADPAALLALPPGLLPPGVAMPPAQTTAATPTAAAVGREGATAVPAAARDARPAAPTVTPEAAPDTAPAAQAAPAATTALTAGERFKLPEPALPAAAEHKVRAGEAPVTPNALMQVAAPAPAPAPAAAAALAAPVGTPAWNTELGQQIVWMVGEKQQVAELHVNPPDLGPLDIKLTVDGTQTTAVFTSPHSAVREAVESALPRLREVLADSGLQLGNASVTADSPRDGNASGGERGSPRRAAREEAPAELGAVAPRRLVSGTRGLVDLFA